MQLIDFVNTAFEAEESQVEHNLDEINLNNYKIGILKLKKKSYQANQKQNYKPSNLTKLI